MSDDDDIISEWLQFINQIQWKSNFTHTKCIQHSVCRRTKNRPLESLKEIAQPKRAKIFVRLEIGNHSVYRYVPLLMVAHEFLVVVRTQANMAQANYVIDDDDRRKRTLSDSKQNNQLHYYIQCYDSYHLIATDFGRGFFVMQLLCTCFSNCCYLIPFPVTLPVLFGVAFFLRFSIVIRIVDLPFVCYIKRRSCICRYNFPNAQTKESHLCNR